MTIKEKNKLGDLVSKIVETTDILHPPAAEELCAKVINSTDEKILDILIQHMEFIRIYEIYRRFDQEASVRDIDKLLGIISNISGEIDQDD